MAATPEGGGSGSGGVAAGSWSGEAEGFRNTEGGRLWAAREPEGRPGLRGDDGGGRRYVRAKEEVIALSRTVFTIHLEVAMYSLDGHLQA
ncbi:hypothetical protein J1605_007745 [Eschrichtius robustus]|uniref:Uncharacterized protein n=1 Tax=Eschrichtius robustus TaxID=9764 RepID=A0AB34H0I6_ESCRO|nr:hypothetical protein J1605_007745 [Eschrichtius robustus]